MAYYQVRIALQHVRPTVRRRIVVPGGLDFSQFAAILICAMGWQGYHEYLFRLEDQNMTIIRDGKSGSFIDAMFSPFVPSEDKKKAHDVKIDHVFAEGYSFWFDYDFGDGWEHGVKIEKTIKGEQEVATVLQFEGNCPPEDVGGPGGYENFLRIINDSSDPEYEAMTEWGQSQWYEDYDVDIVNAQLRALARKDYDETAVADAYDDALLELASARDSAAPHSSERGLYAGTGYRDRGSDFSDIDFKANGKIPDSFGPNCIWRVIERIDEMTEDEKGEAFQNPETELGFLSMGRGRSTNLREILQDLSVEKLKALTEAAEIPLSGRRGKPALVEAIYDYMMDVNAFYRLMSKIDDEEEIAFIGKIMTSEEPYRITGSNGPYMTLVMLHWVFAVTSWWDGYELVIVPVDEMRVKYAEAIERIREVTVQIIDTLDNCARAAVNLYGIVALDEFVRIFAAVTAIDEDGEPMKGSGIAGMDEKSIAVRLAEIIKTYVGGEADYFLSDNLLVCDELRNMKKRELREIHEAFVTRPRRILPREEFLKYADWSYYDETEAHSKLRAYAERKVRAMMESGKPLPEGYANDADPAAVAEEIIQDASMAIRSMAPFKVVLEIFEGLDDGFETRSEAEELISTLAEVSNHTRTWGLGGSTPEEIGELMQLDVTYKRDNPKIGRNAPCPCGSGKKYKNCCGRNM